MRLSIMSADSHGRPRPSQKMSGSQLHQKFEQACWGQRIHGRKVSEIIGKIIIDMGFDLLTPGFQPTDIWIAKHVTRLNQFKVSDAIKAAAIEYLAGALMVREDCIRQFRVPKGTLFDQHANWPEMLRIVCQVASPSSVVPTSSPAPVSSLQTLG